MVDTGELCWLLHEVKQPADSICLVYCRPAGAAGHRWRDGHTGEYGAITVTTTSRLSDVDERFIQRMHRQQCPTVAAACAASRIQRCAVLPAALGWCRDMRREHHTAQVQWQ
jgi:hypothetical protein